MCHSALILRTKLTSNPPSPQDTDLMKMFVFLHEIPGADPGFLPGEGAKGLMASYGMGMSDF